MFRVQLKNGSFWWLHFNINAMIEFSEIVKCSLDDVMTVINTQLGNPRVLRAYLFTAIKEGNRLKQIQFDYQNELDFFAECESEIPNLLNQVNSHFAIQAEAILQEAKQQKKSKKTPAKQKANS